MMRSLKVRRSTFAAAGRGLVKVWFHSLNGALLAQATEARSSRSVMTWNSSSTPRVQVEVPADAAAAFFQVVSQRHLKTSIVLTTNRGISSWGDVLGDEMIAAPCSTGSWTAASPHLDGDSYRPRSHHARANALRHAVHPHP